MQYSICEESVHKFNVFC